MLLVLFFAAKVQGCVEQDNALKVPGVIVKVEWPKGLLDSNRTLLFLY
jgi:hypothetical protein